MKFVDNYASSYVVDVDPDWPDRGEEVISFLAYDKLKMHTGVYRNIRFYLKTGGSWIGQFELGERKGEFENCVFTVPNPSQACVISSGAGYWVDVEQREAMRIDCLPITQVVISTEHSLILIATWRDLYAYSSSNLSWSLRDIANDSLKIEKIDQDTLTVVGFVMGEMIEMRINLLTGQLIDEERKK